MADAVDDDRVEIDELLDVLGPRLVVAGVDLARQDRPDLVAGQVADHVLRPRVVRVQRDADLEGGRRLRAGPRVETSERCPREQHGDSRRQDRAMPIISCCRTRDWAESRTLPSIRCSAADG